MSVMCDSNCLIVLCATWCESTVGASNGTGSVSTSGSAGMSAPGDFWSGSASVTVTTAN